MTSSTPEPALDPTAPSADRYEELFWAWLSAPDAETSALLWRSLVAYPESGEGER